ncbi:MAG TPA: NADH-quinone oxidoreductase subunit N, partial [Verrucomicrobiota bacterium]|nr:NADH-quinone oxidoreductase subunit N [Verrucomicrobiota bacterium]
MSYADLFKLAVPETVLVIAALVVLAIDLTAMRGMEVRLRFIIGAMVSCIACAAAIGWTIVMPVQGELAGGMMVVNPLMQLIKAGILVLTIFTVL